MAKPSCSSILSAPEQAMAALFTATSQALANAAQNATAQQQLNNTLANAITAAGASMFTKPKPGASGNEGTRH